MKLTGFISRTSSSESIKSNGSKFSLKTIFKKRRGSSTSSSSTTSASIRADSLFEVGVDNQNQIESVPMADQEAGLHSEEYMEGVVPIFEEDEYDFDTDDLTSVDSMFESFTVSSNKQYDGSDIAFHQGKNLANNWEMRYDSILCQFYYINKKDQSIQFDSPNEILQY